MRRFVWFSAMGLCFILLSSLASGQMMKQKQTAVDPHFMKYEGVLTNSSGGGLTGEYRMTFRIYDSVSSVTPLWEESHRVSVEDGEFDVMLGKKGAIPSSGAETYYLGVFVNGEELLPRHIIEEDAITGDEDILTLTGPEQTPYFPVDQMDERYVNVDGDSMSGDLLIEGNLSIGTLSEGPPLYIDETDRLTNFKGIMQYGSSILTLKDISPYDRYSYIQWLDSTDTRGMYLGWGNPGEFIDMVLENGNNLAITGGNVGIGTTNPDSKLHISGNGADITLKSTGDSNGQLILKNDLDNSATIGILRSGSNHVGELKIGNGNRDVMFLTGNVGIGTTDPMAKLHTYTDSSGLYAGYFFNDQNTAGHGLLVESGGSGNATNAFYVKTDVDGGAGGPFDAMIIKGNGNVGIGTANPERNLHVSTSGRSSIMCNTTDNTTSSFGGVSLGADNPWIWMIAHASARTISRFGLTLGGWGEISLSTGDATPNGLVIGTQQNSPLVLGTNDSERMRINSSGNVGIGTSSPGYKLDVNGNFGSTTVNTGQGNYELYAMNQNVRTTDNPTFNRVHLSDYGTALGGLHVGGTSDPGTDNLIVDGNVGIGTSSPGEKLEVIGSVRINDRIKFSKDGYWADMDIYTGHPSQYPRLNIYETPGGGSRTKTVQLSGGALSLQGSSASLDVNGPIKGKDNSSVDYGVYGETASLGHSGGSDIGVYGWAYSSGASVGGAALGVLGRVNSYQGTSASVPAGVFGWATATSGINAGVWGQTESPDGFGVYSAGDLSVDGDFYCNGSKNAVVETSRGQVTVSCMESPEIWFEDFGEGQLRGGRAHIDLDPLFLETVMIDAEHPMKAFIQLNDDCRGVYTKRGEKGFDVIELQGGSSDASFSYRVVAKRKGYEGDRFTAVHIPTKTEMAMASRQGDMVTQ